MYKVVRSVGSWGVVGSSWVVEGLAAGTMRELFFLVGFGGLVIVGRAVGVGMFVGCFFGPGLGLGSGDGKKNGNDDGLQKLFF